MSFVKIFASLFLLASPFVFASPTLPNLSHSLPPEQILQPYPEVSVTRLHSAKALITAFDTHGYQLKAVKQNNILPSYFVENLPNDLNDLPVAQKISVFIRLLLPTIKAVNRDILQVRAALNSLSAKPKAQWTQADRLWLQNVSKHYGVKSAEITELLSHIDIIPAGMVLAQGIDESGWGTSHFAIAGNNLYGEHLPHDGGLFLTTPGGHVKVAAFNNLYQSTASYMHNLNTTLAYRELRKMRQQLRAEDRLTGYELVQSLLHYSTRGQAYVDNLRALIKHHHLDDFDSAKLSEENDIRYRFVYGANN